jgi:steroid 5-alpha reductase family enzyme
MADLRDMERLRASFRSRDGLYQRSGEAPERRVSATACRAAYATALTAATVLAAAAPWPDGWADAPLRRGLALDAAATVVVYGFSFYNNNSSVYDPYWCVLPLWLLFYWKAEAPGGFWFYEPRETTVLACVWAWAWRFFLFVPWEGWTVGLAREDWRYHDLRAKLGRGYWGFSLASLHLTPTLLVYGALAPAARVVLAGSDAPPLNRLDAVALVCVVAALALEAAADETLRRHRAAGKTATCVAGLWGRSRHPNYCGECLFWASLSLFALAADTLTPALAAGPAAMCLFFRLASVPLMDQRSLARRPDYARATRGLPALVPSLRPRAHRD